MKRSARCRRRSGFTLMEVLLVLAILVILGGMVTFYFAGMQKRGFEDSAKIQMGPVKDALRMYHLDLGHYPSASQGLNALVSPPADLPNPQKWRGPYLEEAIPLDPWGQPYQYELLSNAAAGQQFRIYSLGADGQEGTDDDIVNNG